MLPFPREHLSQPGQLTPRMPIYRGGFGVSMVASGCQIRICLLRCGWLSRDSNPLDDRPLHLSTFPPSPIWVREDRESWIAPSPHPIHLIHPIRKTEKTNAHDESLESIRFAHERVSKRVRRWTSGATVSWSRPGHGSISRICCMCVTVDAFHSINI